MFDGFPSDVRWFRAALERSEVLDILFIDWDWWLHLSGGSRRPRDAAERIRAGLVEGVDAESHEPPAVAAATNPELIAVRAAPGWRLVLLEGDWRLTAYALFPDSLPDELELFIVESPAITHWSEY